MHSARWRTARQVGGDFYDIIELPNDRLGLFIADVADKGVPAALFMALTRTLMRAAVQQSDSPAEVLRHFPNGRLARASGIVTHRQRPETARHHRRSISPSDRLA